MRKKNQNERQNEKDRYLITYADLITLLLGLFVILYASSQTDVGKYKEISAAFGEYFDNTNSGQLKSEGVLPAQQGAIPQPILPNTEAKTLDQISQQTEESLEQEIASGAISLVRTTDGVTIRISDGLLFETGRAEIQPIALPVLDTISNIIAGIHQYLIIEGHTDSIPIRSFRYQSNWHLSAARALSVLYYLQNNGAPQRLLSLGAYGRQRPLASNDTEFGRALNRRVEIVIKELPKTEASLEGYEPADSVEAL